MTLDILLILGVVGLIFLIVGRSHPSDFLRVKPEGNPERRPLSLRKTQFNYDLEIME